MLADSKVRTSLLAFPLSKRKPATARLDSVSKLTIFEQENTAIPLAIFTVEYSSHD